jgi:hypothetical protein
MANLIAPTDSFKQILEVVGYSNPVLRVDGRRWQIWNGTFYHPSGQYRDVFLFVTPDCSLGGFRAAVEATGQLPDVREFMIVLQDSSTEILNFITRTQPIPKCNKVLTARELLYNTIKRAIREVSASDDEPYFIEQSLLFGDSNEPSSSVFGLARWLRGASHSDRNVAVLLAPAGSGKTTLARHVFGDLIKNHFGHSIPLLVEKSAWQRLQGQESINLSRNLAGGSQCVVSRRYSWH